ncbi:MAG: 2-hydroxyacyl-CoA dehydratase [Clostridia bacterium]|nr:2-hydroxyacyl-CoA dehydratase [Clostridia bacterium]
MSEEIKRIEFTKEMKETYKILLPNMLSVHFAIISEAFRGMGYDMELLTTCDREIVEEGLKYVHNDTCYPALLVIGQFIHALKSGKYDLNRTAVLITQTGGGCRASNYIHLLRKALAKAGFAQVPVISLNPAGLEKNEGFVINLTVIRRALAGVIYGDALMLLANQTRAYETIPGATDALLERYVTLTSDALRRGKLVSMHKIKKTVKAMVKDFAAIPLHRTQKPKVGIVGEIYVKYSPLANNDLEAFLHSQGCEVNVPGLLGFLQYIFDNNIQDVKLYGGKKSFLYINKLLRRYLARYEKVIRKAVTKGSDLFCPAPHSHVRALGDDMIGLGCKMGEGWLLTAEMMELCESGYENIVCVQPFGCLPNHIVGKGMVRKLREVYPNANIVAVDYDPGATRVNQENRIKLMLSVARENLAEKEKETV